MANKLSINNLNLILLEGLADNVSGLVQNAATLQATVYSDADMALALTGANALDMTYIADSTGDYYAQLQCDLAIIAETTYYVKVVGVGDWANTIEINDSVVAGTRGFSR